MSAQRRPLPFQGFRKLTNVLLFFSLPSTCSQIRPDAPHSRRSALAWVVGRIQVKMGAYKYIEELQKKKQSDLLRYVGTSCKAGSKSAYLRLVRCTASFCGCAAGSTASSMSSTVLPVLPGPTRPAVSVTRYFGPFLRTSALP